MASTDLRVYLEQLLRRMDPSIDLSSGSPAQVELITPLLNRIGPDPFDLDIANFIQTRIRQAFPDLDIQEVDALTDTVVDPMRVLIEPLVREVKLARVRSDLRNYERMSDDEVDALLANYFESRQAGGFAIGTIRVYYASAQSVSFSQTNVAISKNGLRYIPTVPQSITSDEMFLNRDGSEYYVDVNYIAEARGDQYNIDVDQIVNISNLPAATRVRNLRKFRDGVRRETTAEFVSRTQQSLSDKTLTVERGIARVLAETFPDMRRLFVVGYKDPEMERDIITGGSLSAVLPNDSYGAYYGGGTAVSDLTSASTTHVASLVDANLVARLGPVGTDPVNWYVSLIYLDFGATTITAVDARIVEILSNTDARLDVELPLVPGGTALGWVLRKKELTISSIPGGIALPNSPDGESLSIEPGTVHVGGKTDIYVAGSIETATAKLTAITDENPLYQGVSAQTQASIDAYRIRIHDVTVADQTIIAADVTPLVVVLESGVDAGSYQIVKVVTGPTYMDIETAVPVTGNQVNLRWRITDELDVNLTDPKTIKISGDDMQLAAGSPYVVTTSGTNWVDADVRPSDTVRVVDTEVGQFSTEYTVLEVSPTTLKVSPTPLRTFAAIGYTVFTPSQSVDAPVVRISSMELADSSGAGTGTKIPYRDPVLALSTAFQNEGQGYKYDGLVVAGLVTAGAAPGDLFSVGSSTVTWRVCLQQSAWQYQDSGTITFTAGSKTAAQVASEINASTLGSYAYAFTETYAGRTYVCISSQYLVIFQGGTALSNLGFAAGYTNSMIRGYGGAWLSLRDKASRGDVVEVLGHRNAGKWGRLVTVQGPGHIDPFLGSSDFGFRVGTGPTGPRDDLFHGGLYYPTIYMPEIGVQGRIGRASVGTARTYFLSPTSAEVDAQSTVYTTRGLAVDLEFVPDPENMRQVLPYPTQTELPGLTASTSAAARTLTDPDGQFLLEKVKPGDLLEILYRSIMGTVILGPGTLSVSGLIFSLKLGSSPPVQVVFPYDMTLDQCIDYINEQMAADIASKDSNKLRFDANEALEIDSATSTALSMFGADAYDNKHPDAGQYVIASVTQTTLEISNRVAAFVGDGAPNSCRYRVYRHMQRASVTEMNTQVDYSGLYYMDVSLISKTPGDQNNIGAAVELAVTGHRADGYRLTTENSALSYSRAETLLAEISPTIQIVGSLDTPSEALQLSRQNVLVTYERSPLVDEAQSFCDSTFNRVVCEDILVRHLLPNYVSAAVYYVGGSSEANMRREVLSLLDEIEPGDELELSNVVRAFNRQGATSVYTLDPSSSTGRTSPILVVVYHELDRSVRATIVRDQVSTTRTRRFLPDNITLRRVTSSGIR